MRKKVGMVLVFCTFFGARLDSIERAFEHRGCCSHHHGVCGCKDGRAICCDGQTSPTCGCD